MDITDNRLKRFRGKNGDMPEKGVKEKVINRSKAFTLIELLVVVSIIALLVSILLPSLQRAREQTRRVVCASNIRNLYLGLTMYAQDNNGRFPKPVGNVEPWNVGWAEGQILQDSYGCTIEVTTCPTAERDFIDALLNHRQQGWGWGFGYGVITSLNGSLPSRAYPDKVPDAPGKLTDPSWSTVAVDICFRWAHDWGHSESRKYSFHKAPNGKPQGGNNSYLDGSVIWYNPEKMGPKAEGLDTEIGNFDYLGNGYASFFWGVSLY